MPMIEEIITEIIRFELPYYYINEIFIISAFLFIIMVVISGNLNRLDKKIRVELFFYLFFCNHIQNF
jgi:hypothetical protein